MKRFIQIVAMVALAGCQSGTTIVMVKPGSNTASDQAALDQCKIASFREIPQTMVSQTSGGYYNPGQVQCNTYGSYTNCQRVGAVNIAPVTTVSDQNEGIRTRYIHQCLQSKGYALLELPYCRTDAERAASRASPRPTCAAGQTLQ